MSDTASLDATQPDSGEVRHTMSVCEVDAALVAAGVPRSRRQIIRYCEHQMLDAVKVPGPTGAQWYVSPSSLPKVIGDLKQWEAQRARRAPTRVVMASRVDPENTRDFSPAIAGHGAPEPAAPSADESNDARQSKPAIAGFVQQLELRIQEKDDVIGLLKGQLVAKDEQISELSARYRETHGLLGAMQRMLAPLLGQPDPFKATPEPQDLGREGESH